MRELITRPNAVISYPCVSNSWLVETPFSSLKALNWECHYYTINYTVMLKAVCALSRQMSKISNCTDRKWKRSVTSWRTEPLKQSLDNTCKSVLQWTVSEKVVLVPPSLSSMHVHAHVDQSKMGANKQEKESQSAYCYETQTDGHFQSIRERLFKVSEFTIAQSHSNGVRLQQKPFYHKSHTTYHPKKLPVKACSTRCAPEGSLRQTLLSILPPNTLLSWLPKYSCCVVFKLQKCAVVDHNENGVL